MAASKTAAKKVAGKTPAKKTAAKKSSTAVATTKKAPAKAEPQPRTEEQAQQTKQEGFEALSIPPEFQGQNPHETNPQMVAGVLKEQARKFNEEKSASDKI